MRNRAEKDAIRWCHLTHQFIAVASVHSREPKTRVAEVYPYFVSKRFINHSICQTCPAHIVMCINIGNGHVINEHFRAKNSCVSPPLDTFNLRHHHDTSSNQNQMFSSFLILWLFDFSALLLLLAFASSSCLIYKFISKHMRNYAHCYELMS